jgi:hypothetical protein
MAFDLSFALTFDPDVNFLVLVLTLVAFFAVVFAGLTLTFFSGTDLFVGLAVFTAFALTGFLTEALIRVGEEALGPDFDRDFRLLVPATTLTLTFALVFEILESDSLIRASFIYRTIFFDTPPIVSLSDCYITD